MERCGITVHVEDPAHSLMTPIGVVAGDILSYLGEHGTTPLRRLVRDLPWTSPMVMMAVGALIREGLIEADQHELEVVVSLLQIPDAAPRMMELVFDEDV